VSIQHVKYTMEVMVMLRLMSNEDIKDEFRDQLTKSIWCPVLDRYQVLIFCFACSRFSQCDVTQVNGIRGLTVEDVLKDPTTLNKSLMAQAVKNEVKDTAQKRYRSRASKTKATKDQKSVGSGNSKGSKRNVIMSYLKSHPKATALEIARSCNVSQTYARKVLQNQ